MRKKVKGEAGGIGLPLVLYAWISGTAAKIAAAGKKAAAKPSASKSGAVKSGAASAIKSAAKKAVTVAKNTVSFSSQTSKGTSKQNVSGGVKTAGTKLLNAGLSSVKSGGSTGSRSPAKTDWLSKGNAALGDGVLRGISQAVTDIWNQSMSASPIGKLFPEPGKKSGPGIGNTVMEITERVIKEQEQRKEQERIWESRYELRYGASDAERNGAFSENGIEDLLKRAQITEDSLGYETVLVVSEVDKTQWLFPVTSEVKGELNGKEKILHPYETWGIKGDGRYTGMSMKDSEGNYGICVGPKVLDFNYADSGRLWESELEHRYLKILLENKNTGEQISKNCYVVTNKAHTYNTYPDGHENNILGEAHFDIDNGWFQTGISYPGSINASGSAALALDNVDGSIIEFATDKLDFNPSDYRLLQITILDK